VRSARISDASQKQAAIDKTTLPGDRPPADPVIVEGGIRKESGTTGAGMQRQMRSLKCERVQVSWYENNVVLPTSQEWWIFYYTTVVMYILLSESGP
jgi:hypothetical protein